ncbi:MAG: hypothetical protein KF688_02075 [Pirellulales bacterium]|nr:hypothetical protein [Pirellulales bacterium]
MNLTFHYILAFAAVAVAGLVARALPVRKHALFLFVLAQAVVYCFAAPTLNLSYLSVDDPILEGWYLKLQFACLVLFIPVLVASYVASVRRLAPVRGGPSLTLNRGMVSFLAIFSLVSSLSCLATLVHYRLLFRSIGHSALAAEYLNLPTFVFLFIRGYDRLLLPLVVTTYLALLRSSPGPERNACRIAFGSTFLVQFVIAALNSRLLLATTILLLGSIRLLIREDQPRVSSRTLAWRAVLGGAVVLVGVNFTINLRHNWRGTLWDSLDVSLLTANSLATESTHVVGDIAARLDGIDLMALMAPELRHRGFSWGESWVPGILATAGYLWDPGRAEAIKADLATTPKYYLMYDYAGIDKADYPSCILTDAYGNFGLVGVVAAAGVLGFICALARQYVANPPTRFAFAAGIVAMQVAAHFEGSFLFHVFLGWLQYAPAAAVLVVVLPFRSARRPQMAPAYSPQLISAPCVCR